MSKPLSRQSQKSYQTAPSEVASSMREMGRESHLAKTMAIMVEDAGLKGVQVTKIMEGEENINIWRQVAPAQINLNT